MGFKMSLKKSFLYSCIILLGSFFVISTSNAQNKYHKIRNTKDYSLKAQATKSSDPWTVKNIYLPKELAQILTNKKAKKPVILQVGFSFLYNQNHIIGSKYMGPAFRAKGIETLKNEVKKYNLNENIVLYCGCCPWVDCPNIRPAFKAVKKLGYKNVHVLYIQTNFVQNWMDKDYPSSK